MSDLSEMKRELMADPEFKMEYEALSAEYAIRQAMLNARLSSGMTQQQLAANTGMSQADISKLENGTWNPSIKTLDRVARGMGKTLKIEFVDTVA